MGTVTLEPYGKAVAVKGDTQQIKEFLKQQGGRWNKNIVGWIFPGAKKDELKSRLLEHKQVQAVNDKFGGQGASVPEKRKAEEPASSSAKKAKAEVERAPVTATSSADGQEWDLPGLVKCSISSFGGKLGVDVRKYWASKDAPDDPKPSAKGVRLNLDEWEVFREKLDEIETARESDGGGDAPPIKVRGDLNVSIRSGFPNMVDIRRFYTDKSDGAEKPGKKGICLTGEQWLAFKECVQEIHAALHGAPVKARKDKVKAKGASHARMAAALSEDLKAQEDEEEDNEEAAPEEDAEVSRMREALEKILKGRDFNKVVLKQVRAELEAALGMEHDTLLPRRDEIRSLVTELVEKLRSEE